MSLAFQAGVMSLPKPNSKMVCKYRLILMELKVGSHDFVC